MTDKIKKDDIIVLIKKIGENFLEYELLVAIINLQFRMVYE